MAIKLVVFDYDGLLVESEKLAFLAEKKIIAKYGKTLTMNLFDRYIGYSVNDTLKGYITYFRLPVAVEELYKEREIIIAHLLKTRLRLMPGVLPVLKYFNNRNIDMVIASSGEHNYIKDGLEKLNIAHFFKNITSVSEVRNGKPNPDLFLEALKKNNVKPREAIVFEDSLSGVKAAKTANIFCIAVPPKNRDISQYREANLAINNIKLIINFFGKVDYLDKLVKRKVSPLPSSRS